MKITPLKKKLFSAALILAVFFGAWYFSRTPSNDREWSIDQRMLPYAEFSGNEAILYNIRNFKYESVDRYTPAYYDRSFNLDRIISLDYIVEPFGSIGAAHTFVSFGFENGDHVAISAEIRKEIGESFSPLKGLLRTYELMYVVADERDVIKLRTNFRKDTVYLYPVLTTQENMKRLFIDMLTRANTLREEPEFYNTFTNTCTTNIARHVNMISPGRIPWDFRLLLPEYSDVLAYELGLIDNTMPLELLRTRYKINDLAEQYADDENFSDRIRKKR